MDGVLNNIMEETIFDLMIKNICPNCPDYESRCDHVGSCTEQCLNNHGLELSSSAVERLYKQKSRDNLLVTAGIRAAEMEALGIFELPSSVVEQDQSIGFIIDACDKYIDEGIDISFDEYIEAALIEMFGCKEKRDDNNDE